MILIDEISADGLIRFTTSNGSVRYKIWSTNLRWPKYTDISKSDAVEIYGEGVKYLPDANFKEWYTINGWGSPCRMNPQMLLKNGYYDDAYYNWELSDIPADVHGRKSRKKKDAFYFYPLGDGLYKIGISTTDNVTWRMRSVRSALATVNVEPKAPSPHQSFEDGGWKSAFQRYKKIHSKWVRTVDWRTYHTPTASLLESEVKKFLKDCQVCKFGTDEQKAHLGTSDGYTEVYSLSDFDIEMLHFLINQHGCRETTCGVVKNWGKFWNSYPTGESDAF